MANGENGQEFILRQQHVDEGFRVMDELDKQWSGQVQMDEQQMQQMARIKSAVDMELSNRLMADEKTFGDSKYMKNVKADLANVANLLDYTRAADLSDEVFDRARTMYFHAVNSCDAYLENRNADKGRGLERRRLVANNRARLIREMELISQAKELFNTGRLQTLEGTTLRAMLTQVRVYDFASAPAGKRAIEKQIPEKDPIELKGFFDVFRAENIKDIKDPAGHAKEISKLRRILKEIPEGKAYSVFIEVKGKKFLLTSDEENNLTLSDDETSSVIRERVYDLLQLIDGKIIEETALYDDDTMRDVIYDQSPFELVDKDNRKVLEKSIGDIQRSGSRLSRFLELRTGKSATAFAAFSAEELMGFANRIINGESIDNILAEVEANHEEESYINNREVLDLLHEKELLTKEEIDSKVEYRVQQKERGENDWTPQEESIKNLVADLVFSAQTWEADDSQTEPGERIRRMLLSNKKTLVMLIMDAHREDQDQASILEKTIDRLPEMMDAKEDAAFKEKMKNTVKELTDKIDMFLTAADFAMSLWGESIDEKKVEDAVDSILQSRDADLMDYLAEKDDEINDYVENASVLLQDKIDESMKVQTNEGDEGEEEKKKKVKKERGAYLSPMEKGIDKDEKARRIKDGDERLTEMFKESMQGDSGQGKFIKVVFQNYFKSVGILDKRSMFGSAIRNSAPALEKTPENKKKEAGRYIGGILKGAGPLFQKMLQGLPTNGLSDEMKDALEDMKSKLAPIPEEVVKAQLLGIVQRSKGKITSIKVDKSLGAASVGQTFFCRIFGPGLPEDGKSVVVKLLKPDVRNRMLREKDIMLRCARMTDNSGGMEATYLGQLSRIEEELDLTIEARNVVKGEVYDNSTDYSPGVRAMKLDDLAEATVNCMVLEKAPGTTVDRYLKDLDEKNTEREQGLTRKQDEQHVKAEKVDMSKAATDEEKKNLQAIQNRLKDEAKAASDEADKVFERRLIKERKEILKDLTTLLKRQKYMTVLADKWVNEGIFGKGFYHGDLHAGNIMIDDDGATVIDFGNATTLDEEQQIQVTRMVAAAAAGDPGEFMDGLHKLINPQFNQRFIDRSTSLSNSLKEIFALGDKNSAGYRVAVSLLKAQELGLEVPSAIFNFSQCQLRLQNAIEEMNAKIKDMKKLLGKYDMAIAKNSLVTTDADLFRFAIYFASVPANDTEDEKQILKRELDNLYLYYSACNAGNIEIGVKEFEDGDFYDRNLSRFEEKKFTGVKKELSDYLRKTLSSPAGYKDNAFYQEVSRILKPLSGAFDTNEEHDLIVAYFKSAIKEMTDKKQTAPSEGDLNFVKGVEERLTKRANEYKALIGHYNEAQKACKKKKTKEEKQQIIEEFRKEFVPFNVVKKKYSGSELKPIFTNVRRAVKNGAAPEAILRDLDLYDQELVRKFKEDYASILQYKKEHPDELTEKSELEDKVILDVMNICADQMKPIYDDLISIYSGYPMSFVEVMGDTISRNLTESLKRLGTINAYKYGKILSD